MTREEEIIDSILGVLKKFSKQLQGFQVVLFGSRARGDAKARSDFDLGVVGRKSLDIKTFYEIDDKFDELENLYRIDWVDLNRVSSNFRRIALKNAVKIYG